MIVALLALELLSLGTIAMALGEANLARDREDGVRAGQAARSAVANSVARWTERLPQRLAVGETAQFPEVLDGRTSVLTEVERLSAQLFLIRASATLRRGPVITGSASFGFLVASHDLTSVGAAIPGAVGTAGRLFLSGDAVVDGSQPDGAPDGWAESCEQSEPTKSPGIAARSAGLVRPGPDSEIRGTPAVLETPSVSFDRLGPLDLAALLAAVDRTESGSLDLGPVVLAGRCAASADGNWGAPLDQASPCAPYFPLIHAPGDLILGSGAGQGVLIVEGDLTIAPGARFFGIILALGRVLMGDDAQITGALLIGESVRPSVIQGGAILLSRCAIGRALTHSPALNRPILRHGRRWLPTF